MGSHPRSGGPADITAQGWSPTADRPAYADNHYECAWTAGYRWDRGPGGGVTATSSVIPRSVIAIASIWRGAWGGKRSIQSSVHVMRALPTRVGSKVKTSAS